MIGDDQFVQNQPLAISVSVNPHKCFEVFFLCKTCFYKKYGVFPIVFVLNFVNSAQSQLNCRKQATSAVGFFGSSIAIGGRPKFPDRTINSYA